MLNYLKWELKNYFSNKYKWFIVIAVVYILMAIIPLKNMNGVFTSLIALSFSIILFVALIGTYFAGTKHAVDTFRKKTFLLESMIPVPAKKILLCKYLLGIIINLVYAITLIIGVSIVLVRGVGLEEAFEAYKQIIEHISFETILTIITTSIFFLSTVVLGFVAAKAVRPGSKHDKVTGFVFAFLLLYFISYILVQITGTKANIYIINLSYVVMSTIVFFITSYLIENKLEIYN